MQKYKRPQRDKNIFTENDGIILFLENGFETVEEVPSDDLAMGLFFAAGILNILTLLPWKTVLTRDLQY